MRTDMTAFLQNRALAVLGGVLFHSLWQGVLVATAAAVGLWLLRRSPASWRYTMAYASLLLLPVASAISLWCALAGGAVPLLWMTTSFLQAWRPMLSWLAVAWILGVSVASVRVAGGWLRVRQIRSTVMAADPLWQRAVDAMATRLGVRQSVRLVETAMAEVPGVVGWLSPMILFPVGAMAGLNAVQIRLIITHELAHIRRDDYLFNVIQTTIDTAFFYHPGVWWLSKRIRIEREHCCDDVVVVESGEPDLYAAALVSIERLRADASPRLALAAGGGDLLGRIQRLINRPAFSTSRAPAWVIAMWVALPLSLATVSIAASTPILGSHLNDGSTLLVGAFLGFILGMRHALEPDHLVAVSTLVTEKHDGLSGARLGAWWGIGHTATLVLGGTILVLVQFSMPEGLANGLEFAVALMLIGLGARALRTAWRMASTGAETVHSHGARTHAHRMVADHVHVGPFAMATRPLLVGLVHGMAGSGALAALVMASLPSVGAQLAYILVFGLGSTLGMMLLSGLAGVPLGKLTRQPATFAWVSGVAGAVSVAVGLLFALILLSTSAGAQTSSGHLAGTLKDATGGVLPGVLVELTRPGLSQAVSTTTNRVGEFQFDALASGQYDVTFTLINFAPLTRRGVSVTTQTTLDAILQLTLTADVTVTGRGTFTNLADVADPTANLVGVADSASEGAITARQIEMRPIMRAGEVLEAVPGLIISQHSGEGKANQYYLRGFNLDHGTDFATTIAGIPVNMPTHGHGHGYTDANFLIPELVSGVQFKKGPYYAEEGDFSAAGAVNVNYVNSLESPVVEVSGGGEGWGRVLAAGSMKVGRGDVLGAVELNHNDGPWELPDDYRKLNGVVRYSQGGAAAGFSLTGMMYHGEWNSTDQVPDRAIQSGLIPRFGNIDPSDGGETHRYSASTDAQWAGAQSVTRANAYLVNYKLNLFSNFTYFLDDPDNGDQFEQADERNVMGGRLSHRRLDRWGGRPAENLFGVQVRHDAIGTVGLYHTHERERLSTTREDSVGQTSIGFFAQNEYHWTPVIRTTVGLRTDIFRFNVTSDDPENSGVKTSALASPKVSTAFGPWGGTELYINAGYGFHSNDARGATITRDPGTGDPVDPSTPLVRARGAEVGFRTVRIPHVQTTVSVWGLAIESELLFVGDAGTTDAGRPSRRMGVEWATYASPRPWLSVDADVAISRARFTDEDEAGDYIPGSVESVVSAGLTADYRRMMGSLRLRYFGPRALVEDDSVRSEGTALVNLQAAYRFSRRVSLVLDVFNLFDEEASDIDYFYASRLPGEPLAGIDDVHTHPALPRSVRLTLRLGL
ncbi:MAG: TonB-dependent receptor [Vicinamibacterales bacterium]|nr:TonB-dependent receptor [Vicinamibacterales bacterium]